MEDPCSADDYKSPWAAIDEANALAWELGTFEASPFAHGNKDFSRTHQCHVKQTPAKTVSFHDEVGIVIGPPDHLQDFYIHAEDLRNWKDKPWKYKTCSTSRTWRQTFKVDDGAEPLVPHPHDEDPLGTVGGRPRPTATAPVARWIQDLIETLHVYEREERAEEAHLTVCRTWYLHHERVKRWQHWREFRIDAESHNWREELITLWRDTIRPEEDIDIAFVAPAVRDTVPGQGIIGDIIVSQAGEVRQLSILTAMTHRYPHSQEVRLLALSVPPRQPRHDLLRRCGVMITCWHHECNVHRGDRALHDGFIDHLDHSGINILIDYQEQINDDLTGFMQFPIPDWARDPDRLQEETNNAIALLQQICPDAIPQQEASQPSQPPALPIALRNLYDHLFVDRPDTDIDDLGAIVTWYLDHARSPRCDQSRRVQLEGDPHNWYRTILRTWQDQIDRDVSLNFLLVRPNPPGNYGDATLPHLIVQQRPAPEMRSILISASHLLHHPGHFVHWAIAVPTSINKRTVIEIAGASQDCVPVHDDQVCQVWWGQQLIHEEAPVQVQPGASIKLLAPIIGHQASIPTLAGDETDEVWLMQNQNQLQQTFSPTNNGFAVQHVGAPLSHEAVLSPVSVQTQSNSKNQDRQSLGDITNHPSEWVVNHEKSSHPAFTPSVTRWSRQGEAGLGDMPAFVQALHALGERQKSHRYCGPDQSFAVHSWYVDHVRFSVQLESKLTYLGKDFTQWQRQLLSAWRGIANENEEAIFHLVQPRPLNDLLEEEIHVLITQRPIAGLASVLIAVNYPNHFSGYRRRVAVAFSRVAQRADIIEFSEGVIITESDALQCDGVYLGEHALQQDRLHVLQDGFYLSISVRTPNSTPAEVPPTTIDISPTIEYELTGSTEDLRTLLQTIVSRPFKPVDNPILRNDNAVEHDLESEESEDHTDVHDIDPQDNEEDDSPYRSPEDDPISNDTADFIQSVLVYEVGRNERHAYARWHSHPAMIRSIASAVGIHIDEVYMLHDLQHRPTGISDDAYPLILQKYGDVPIGSTDKIVVTDLIIHNVEAPTVTDRRTAAVHALLTRSQLLVFNRVDLYCEQMQNRCIVKHNGELWKLQDQAPRAIEHGAYFQIWVPPWETAGVLTAQAIWSCQTRSQVPSIEDAFPVNHRTSEDGRDFDPVDNHLSDDEDVSSESDHSPAPTLQDIADAHLGSPDDGFIEDVQWYWQDAAAVEFDEIGPVAYFVTWYLHGERSPRCHVPRHIALEDDRSTWKRSLANLWRDYLDPNAAMSFYVVHPEPPSSPTERLIAGHIILTQALAHRQRATHMTVVRTDLADTPYLSWAMITGRWANKPLIYGWHMIQAVCPPMGPRNICICQTGDHVIDDGEDIDVYNGQSFHSVVARKTGDDDGDTLLLTSSVHTASQLRHEPVDARQATEEDNGNYFGVTEFGAPQDAGNRHVLCLNRLLSPDKQTCIIHLVAGSPMQGLPDFLELPCWYNAGTVAQELRHWGFDCGTVKFGSYDKVLCLDPHARADGDTWHYLYANIDTKDDDGAFLHSCKGPMEELDHMKLLHSLGYQRALPSPPISISGNIALVEFRNVVGTVEPNARDRLTSKWPEKQASITHRPPTDVLQAGLPQDDEHFQLRFRRSREEIIALFQSSPPLCQDCDQLDLPEDIRTHVENTSKWSPEVQLDRLIIYTDGSSIASHRHAVPDSSTDPSVPCDAWSFAVLGEVYGDQERLPEVYFVGWQAQPIIYDAQQDHWIGAQKIGAEITEKEGLFWALIWRIGCGLRLPTVFRPDSMVAGGQAQGLFGSQQVDQGLRCLRGAYQLLQTLLPGDLLKICHVRGHTNEPWNELVDCAAKTEARKSFFHPRQNCVISEWFDDLPHLWTLFDKTTGLPDTTQGGHCPKPPTLPAHEMEIETRTIHKFANVDLHISIASGNVQSLYRGPDGHEGKVAYLRKQMIELHLLFLGLQETRSEAGLGQADSVLRFSSGAQGHHYGVELWVNTNQPFAILDKKPIFLCKRDFVVVHADPCLLIVHLVHEHFAAWLVVAHGPQSGRNADDRHQWWIRTRGCVTEYTNDEPVFLMIDANAASGDSDDIHVGIHDDPPSVNTPDFRELLMDFDLCLPSTFRMHQGDHDTWVRADGNMSRRIDFIGIPCSMLHACVLSRVVDEFDMGQEYDHSMVAVELKFSRCQAMRINSTGKRHRTKIHGDVKSLPAEGLASIQVEPWHCDIGTHVRSFNDAVHSWMSNGMDKDNVQWKKPYITDEIWQARTDKLCCRRAVRLACQEGRDFLLYSVWRAWTSRGTCAETLVDATQQCQAIKAAAAMYRASKQVRSLLKQAKKQAVKDCLENLEPNTCASGILRALKPHIGPSNAKKHKKCALPIVKQADGRTCSTPSEALDRWIEYFMQMEGGTRVDDQTQWQLWRDGLKELQAPSVELHWDQMPSLLDLETACRKVRLGRATGPDGVPSDVIHHFAPQFARLLYTQLLKLALHGQEALDHKGGRLAAAYKWKGPQDSCCSYRSLLVSSHPAKTIHKALRTQCCDAYERYMQSQQLGGRRGVPVQLALHLTRAYVRSHRAQGRCVAVLFVDLKEAFYRVVRGLTIDTPTSDELLRKIAEKLQLNEHMVATLLEELNKATALQRAGLPEHAQRFIHALHRDTHFHLDGQSDHCRTECGTRPGDSWADVIFGFTWARLLHDVQHELVTNGILDLLPRHAPWQPFGASPSCEGDPIPFLGSTWMDDQTLCISGSCCTDLEARIGFAASALLDRCVAFGMSPNLAAGKTELLFSVQGKGSRTFKKKYFGGAASGKFPIVGEHQCYEIDVVGEYCHLGNLLHHTGQDGLEMQKRLGIAHQAFTTHRKLIYANSDLAMDKRHELFNSLILSKLLYGSEVWVFHKASQGERFHSGVMRLYKRLGGFAHDAHVRDEDILHKCRALTPMELLRRQRLRYLCTLYKCQDHVPWYLLQADQQWGALLQDDFRWLYQQLHYATHLPDPELNPQPWMTVIRSHPSYWKRLIRRAFTHAVEQRALCEEVRAFHVEAMQALEECGELCAPPPPKPSRSFCDFYGCLSCGVRCRSLGGEGAHMFRCHGQTAQHRRFCAGTQCSSCLREFHTAGRLANHMRTSTKCRSDLHSRGFHAALQPSIGSQDNTNQERKHNGTRTWQTAAGPALPAGHRAEDPYVHEEFFAYIAENVLQDAENFEARLREAPQHFALSWTRFQLTWDWFLRSLGNDDLDICPLSLEELQHIGANLLNPRSWTLFAGEDVQTSEGGPLQLHDLENRLCMIAQHEEGPWMCSPTIPRKITKEKVLLHVFSGRRRPGDLQFYVDRMAQDLDTFQVYVVSLDVIVDPVMGDLRAPGTKAFWLDAIRQGFVAGLMAGPPCESWSIARTHQLAKDLHRRMPRVVRSGECLWGLWSLALKELMQVRVGNDLLCFVLLGFLYLFLCGRTGVIEHPALPDQPDAASIWRLPIVCVMLQMPGVHLHKIWQGLYGAESTKPTHFMTLNLPNFVTSLHSTMIAKEPPRGGSIGLSDTGQFKTSRLKEYPPALNYGLAKSFFGAFVQETTNDATEVSIPVSFLEEFQKLICTEYGEHLGKDYAG